MAILLGLPIQTIQFFNARLLAIERHYSMKLTTKFLSITFALATFFVPASPAFSQIWFEDFTDGNISDDSGISWTFSNDYDQTEAGIIIDGGSLSWITSWEEVPQSASWSIRVEAQLLQNHGYFGPAVAPNNGPGGSLWAELNTSRKVGFGPSGGTHIDQSGPLEVSGQESAIVQFDTTPTHAFVWTWSPDELPDPLLDENPQALSEVSTPNGYPAVWLNNSDGGAELLIKNIAFSNEHLPIGVGACDVDANGLCDGFDIDSGRGQLGSGFNLDWWLTTAGQHNVGKAFRRGDIDFDGKVNASDLNELALNWQSSDVNSYLQGDLNGDGEVNATDLNEVALNWQSSAVAAPVPEPNGYLPFAIAFIWAAKLFGRRRIGDFLNIGRVS